MEGGETYSLSQPANKSCPSFDNPELLRWPLETEPKDVVLEDLGQVRVGEELVCSHTSGVPPWDRALYGGMQIQKTQVLASPLTCGESY